MSNIKISISGDKISTTSTYNNISISGAKNQFYYVLNKILEKFSDPLHYETIPLGTVNEDTGEQETTTIIAGNTLPPNLPAPSAGDIAVGVMYHNYWDVFEEFKREDYLSTAPSIMYDPYAIFSSSAVYSGSEGDSMTEAQYNLWNNQHKLLQHIVCRNLKSYVNGGYVNGNYSKDNCSNGKYSNGNQSNGSDSHGSKSNGSKSNGVVDYYKGQYHTSSYQSNGTNTHGSNSNGSKSNGKNSLGSKENSTNTQGTPVGTCGAQGDRIPDILCKNRTMTTCSHSTVPNYSETEVTAFKNDTSGYITY